MSMLNDWLECPATWWLAFAVIVQTFRVRDLQKNGPIR